MSNNLLTLSIEASTEQLSETALGIESIKNWFYGHYSVGNDKKIWKMITVLKILLDGIFYFIFVPHKYFLHAFTAFGHPSEVHNEEEGGGMQSEIL